MNFRRLSYFCAVARAGSAAQAAAQLYVAPTAVSMGLSQLEDECGGRLFDRSTRPMRLTPLGAFLLPRAEELLAQADRLHGDVRRVAAAGEGWLGVGFTRSAMLSVLPEAIRRFRKQHPAVRLELLEAHSEHQPALMAEGKIHAGVARFVGAPPAVPGLVSHTLFEEDLLAAMPAEAAQRNGNAIPLAQLACHPFVLYPADARTRYAAALLDAARREGHPFNVQHEARELHTALGMVAAGLGVTLVGASVAAQIRAGVVFRQVEGLPVTSSLVVWSPASDDSSQSKAFVGLLVDAARSEAAAAPRGRALPL